jgi:murein DD-endopeptidase MepM/ murein hydrolase activator NlpD
MTVASALAIAVVGATLVPLLAVSRSSAISLTGSRTGLPPRALAAYEIADSWCPGLRWQLVAAIGQIESGHGTHGGAIVDAHSGEASPWIFGPPLDGNNGTQRLPVGEWLGWWGLPGPWEQAVGPMQFRAPTFIRWAVDADGDGEANPHDLDDAAATAADFLCEGQDGSITDERAAVLRYNASGSYADDVLALADELANPALVVGDGWLCPVAGPVSFTDTWGAPRSGGRTHAGVDMFAALGTAVVAPVDGTVEHRANSVGGPSFHLWGDDGNYYYGTHLSRYGSVTGWVAAGTIVGYVGGSGNAAGTSPHLHFEIHPGRGSGEPPAPVNPTEAVAGACEGNRLGAAIDGGE